MFSSILKGTRLAASPTGRKLIRRAVKFARSDEGRKLVSQAKTVAASPEARQLRTQAAQAVRHITDAATKPENQQRVKAAATYLRRRAGR